MNQGTKEWIGKIILLTVFIGMMHLTKNTSGGMDSVLIIALAMIMVNQIFPPK